MKKKLFATAIFISVLSFTSCNQEDEQVYSCNKDANTWVKKNMTKVHSMSRSEWESMDEEYAKAAYAAFTQEQKIKFWKEKIDQTLTLPWNDKELAHIKKLEDFINTHQFIFSDKRINNNDEDTFERFCYKWCKDAETKLGWNKKIINSIIASGYTIKNTQGETTQRRIKTSATMRTASESIFSKCNCNIQHDFCTSDGDCMDSKCNKTTHNCGWLLYQKCNGTCGGL